MRLYPELRERIKRGNEKIIRKKKMKLLLELSYDDGKIE